MNYSLKIDVKKLNKAFVMPIQGKTATVECVCIPTSEFYKGKNCELYSNIEIVESSHEILSLAAKQTIEELCGKFPKPKEEVTLRVPINYGLK